MTRWTKALVAFLLAAIPAAARAQPASAPPTIEVEETSCLRAESLSQLCASVDSSASLAYVRAYFRAGGTSEWYYVGLEPTAAGFCSAIPSPLASTPSVEFYVEASDVDFRVAVTPAWSSQVTKGGECGTPVVSAASLNAPTVVRVASTDAVAVPPGFQPLGLATTGIVEGAAAATPPEGSGGTATGEGAAAAPVSEGTEGAAAAGSSGAGGAEGAAAAAAAATGGAAAAASGGLSGAALAGIVGGGAAAAVGVGVAASGGDDSGGQASSTLAVNVDADGDGFSVSQGDCNDANPAVSPAGRIEVSNARFEVDRFECVVDSFAPYFVGVLVDFRNNSCTEASIRSVETLSTLEATPDGTGGFGPGFRRSGADVTVDPAAIAPNRLQTVRFSYESGCGMQPFPPGFWMDVSVQVEFDVVAGPSVQRETVRAAGFYRRDYVGGSSLRVAPSSTAPRLQARLDANGAVGRIVLNDQVVGQMPAGASVTVDLPGGRNRIRARVLGGAEPGTWEFRLAPGAGGFERLVVESGRVVGQSETSVLFRVGDVEGAEVAFGFEVGEQAVRRTAPTRRAEPPP